jgi:hypothetical protein
MRIVARQARDSIRALALDRPAGIAESVLPRARDSPMLGAGSARPRPTPEQEKDRFHACRFFR